MSQEIEELQRRKSDLENELQSLDDKEKTLDHKIKVLEEKVAIQDLNNRIKAKRDAVDQFETRVRDLEQKLEEPHWEPKAEAQVAEPSPPEATAEEEPIHEDAALIEPDLPETPKTEHEPRRKRKFF